jgi:hypothetical protein
MRVQRIGFVRIRSNLQNTDRQLEVAPKSVGTDITAEPRGEHGAALNGGGPRSQVALGTLWAI